MKDQEKKLSDARRLVGDLNALGEVHAPSDLIPMVLGRVGLADVYFSLDSPIGPVFVGWNERGVSALMPGEDAARFEEAFRARFGRSARRIEGTPPELARAIEAQLSGGRAKGLEFDLQGLSEFEQAVLHKALEIPRGEVRPYAWVAAEIAHPQAVRAVGTALGRNPIPLLIPCHRVVRSDGRVGNYALGSEAKWALLRAEGAEPDRLEELAGKGVRYYGSDTTRIYCYPTCQHARRISEEHRVVFRSAAEAATMGYRPCKICRPVAVAA